ncbi:MAG: Hsp20/alpha crystallin family protein [Candidatus Wildermuthbacteria bacterium]|nr:Hsp20/alpha crystallin family protein [Candidatus Wildermuthbacteria bacterium]
MSPHQSLQTQPSLQEKSEEKKKIPIKEEPAEKETRSQKEGNEGKDWLVAEGELAIDMYQTESEIVMQAAIAGIGSNDLEVIIEKDIVTISGERRNPLDQESKEYFYQECFWGPFSRQIILPEEVDVAKAEATIKNGIFTLRIPKDQEKIRVKKIKVKG